MAKAGRPRVFDDFTRDRFCLMISLGWRYRDAALALGCSPVTVRREARRNPKFDEDWRKAEQSCLSVPLYTVKKAAAENWKAATWFLEKTYPARCGKPESQKMRYADLEIASRELVSEITRTIPQKEVRERVRKRIEQTIELWGHDLRLHGSIAKARRKSPRRWRDEDESLGDPSAEVAGNGRVAGEGNGSDAGAGI